MGAGSLTAPRCASKSSLCLSHKTRFLCGRKTLPQPNSVGLHCKWSKNFSPPKWGRFPGETSPPRQSEKWWVLHSTPNWACTGGLSGGGRSCSGRENKTLYLKHKISRCFSNQGKEKAECLVGWGRAVVEWIPEPKGSSVWTPSSLQLGVCGAPCGCFCSLQLSNILI